MTMPSFRSFPFNPYVHSNLQKPYRNNHPDRVVSTIVVESPSSLPLVSLDPSKKISGQISAMQNAI